MVAIGNKSIESGGCHHFATPLLIAPADDEAQTHTQYAPMISSQVQQTIPGPVSCMQSARTSLTCVPSLPTTRRIVSSRPRPSRSPNLNGPAHAGPRRWQLATDQPGSPGIQRSGRRASRRPVVQLRDVATRAFRAVADVAIRLRDPRLTARSHRIGAAGEKRPKSGSGEPVASVTLGR